MKRSSASISEAMVQASAIAGKPRAIKSKKTCFRTRPAVMMYAAKALLKTAKSTIRKKNSSITTAENKL